MRMNIFAMLACSSLALSGCQMYKNVASPTAESLGNDVAGILGVRPGQVEVTDIESQNNKTYFTAKTSRGIYNCSEDSGALVALVSPTISRSCTLSKKLD